MYVVAQSSASAAILAQADQTNGSGWFNGDDAVVLRKGTTILDVIGQIGVDPGNGVGRRGSTSTADNTLRRKASVEAGDANGSDAFDPSVEWDGFAIDTFDGLGTHAVTPPGDDAPSVASTTPANGAVDVSRDANIVVTFSEPVAVTERELCALVRDDRRALVHPLRLERDLHARPGRRLRRRRVVLPDGRRPGRDGRRHRTIRPTR